MDIIIKKEKRKSLRLSVKYPYLICQVPFGISQSDINNFIKSNQHFINYQNLLQRAYHPDFKNDDKILWLGQWVDIDDVLSSRSESKFKKKAESVLYEICFEKIKQLQKQVYCPYNEIKIKSLNASWGRCSSKRVLSFSRRLIHYPHAFIQAVVAHEYAHLLEMNHSSAFYEHLYQLYPNYQCHIQLAQGEKMYEILNSRYRHHCPQDGKDDTTA